MKKTKRISVEEAVKSLKIFTDKMGSVILATVDKKGEPFASYAPFVEDEEHNYYIVVSGHVPHSHNMVSTKKASLLFIEDESISAHIFGRKRLYFQARTQKFSKDDAQTEKINSLFVKKFGNKAKMIIDMEDFRIYKLTPFDGSLVLGFGSAFAVSNDRKILTPKDALHQKEHEKSL